MHVIDIIVNDSAMYVFQFKKKNSLMFNQNVITDLPVKTTSPVI